MAFVAPSSCRKNSPPAKGCGCPDSGRDGVGRLRRTIFERKVSVLRGTNTPRFRPKSTVETTPLDRGELFLLELGLAGLAESVCNSSA
jgi:hypothetical protein